MKQFCTTVFLLITIAMAAQFNPLQTQYVRNPYVINPACAGEQGFMSATISARKQWLGFDGAPETFSFTAHSPVKKLKHNFGLLAVQDNLAVIRRTTVSVSYAYRIITSRISFAAGVSPGLELYNNSWSQVVTTQSGDAAFGYTERFTRFNIGFGVYLNAKHFFVGGSGRAVNAESFSLKDQPLMLLGGVRLGHIEKIQVTISNLTRVLPGTVQTDVNVFCLVRNRVGAGIGYRPNDSWMGMLQVQLNDQFSLGYSYDYTVSALRSYSAGSHELLLRYDFGYKVQRPNPR